MTDYDEKAIEAKVIDCLIASKSPLVHTRQIYIHCFGGWHRAEGYRYRRLLKTLHRLEVDNEVFCWNSPHDGNVWMLALRDMRVALPVSYESICRHELPF